MKLPDIINQMIQAQNNWDSALYASCFTEDARVHDEGHTYNRRQQIKHWIDEANKKYRTKMEPIDYVVSGTACVLTATVSGTFPGSPIILKYHVELQDMKIILLKITT